MPLRPLAEIPVPPPRPDETYRCEGPDGPIEFRGLKALLGAADYPKAGDRHAGLAAADEVTREAARTLLAGLTVAHLHERPLTTAAGRVDDVMRVNYDVDREVYGEIAGLTFGELKNRLLAAGGPEATRLGRGLTGVAAAAVAKLCDVHELILVARRIVNSTRARTLLGAPGTLASRLQPNHPTDDPRGIALLCYWGLSLAAGDALIGVNPAIDTVESVSAVLRQLDAIRRRTGAPTQICVLSHIKTQLACLDRGAPVEILFQSLAGTEATNLAEFDITIDLLDRGYETMAVRGPLVGEGARQFMYFETGQGSEFSYGRHEGIDMTTTEALCYGLARRYDPYMVNNVTGFIGPETHLDNFELILASLQDLFMGKLLGLPMGIGTSYTLHANSGLEGQQAATELLAAAGATYFMDVALGTDRMLAYFDTSGHDDQTLREIHGRLPGRAFLDWCLGRGILARDADGLVVRGPTWGRPEQFATGPDELEELIAATPAVHGFQTAGPRPADEVSRRVRWHQAVGRQAVRTPLDAAKLAGLGPLRTLDTQAATPAEHLASPARGALPGAGIDSLAPEPHRVQILVSDGLSAAAVHANVPEIVPLLREGLASRGISVGVPILARHGRVKLAEPVAERLAAEVVVHLLGERPGGDARASRSLSAYLLYRLPDDVRPAAAAASGNRDIRHEYTVISNIYDGGLAPVEAAATIVETVTETLTHQAAGNRLESLLAAS